MSALLVGIVLGIIGTIAQRIEAAREKRERDQES